MSNEIKEANLQLLIKLKQHLDEAEELRATLNRLLLLANASAQCDSSDKQVVVKAG